MEKERQYIAIDLKSFYASVECVERGLDPLDTCLVVADSSRTSKTICLAVSPPLKSLGLGGRPRLFEVERTVREANRSRGAAAGSSSSWEKLQKYPSLAIDCIVAPPRMALYIDYSTRVYKTYLRYVAPEDIHVYSVDEVFIDVTPYLRTYRTSARRLASMMLADVRAATGLTATAGIGPNMYLCKVAMDILAKKMRPDADGMRIAELDVMSYRRLLWEHRPLTDFWRVGSGVARRLCHYGIFTMGDIARCSILYKDFLFRLFGVNAELLIDHAWGCESATMPYIKAYRPSTHSISSGQVLSRPYTRELARNVLLEMADNVALKLLDNRLVTDHLTLHIDYDAENLRDPHIRAAYQGRTGIDHYGRPVPESSRGSVTLPHPTSSAMELSEALAGIFDSKAGEGLLIRRLTVAACRLEHEEDIRPADYRPVPDLFTDFEDFERRLIAEEDALARERRSREAMLKIKKKYGKNAILMGLNYAEGATQRERNSQIGGHKA